MDTIKTTVLSLIAIVACVMILLRPSSFRDDESADIFTATQAFAPTQTALRAEREQSQSVVPELKESPAAASPAMPRRQASGLDTESIDWPVVMYPELARIEALENEPASAALGELSVMLSSDDPAIRLAVIEALGDMTLKEALPGLMAALSDPNSQLRLAALQALAAHDDRSVASVIESVLYDPNTEVRAAAIKALADLESGVSVHALASLLSDPDASIRHQAVYALGDIGGRDAMMYLLQARYDPVATIRRNADAILAELEYEAAF